MVTWNVKGRSWCGLVFAPLVLALSGRAAADERDPRQRDAEAEFRRGVACGRARCACEHFKKSLEHYDQRPSAWVRVALCRSQEGDKAEAWRALQRARELNRSAEQYRDDLEQEIKAELELIPTLTIEVDDPPERLELFLDDAPLPEAPGVAVGVARGTHRVRAEAPGYEVASETVVVDEQRERMKLSLVRKAEALPPPVTPPFGATPVSASADTNAAPGSGSTQRTVGYVFGGVGIVGLGIGAVFGLKTLGLVSDSDRYCDASNECEPEGIRLRERADDSEMVGIVSSVAGGLALGVGLALVLTAPDDTTAGAAEAPPRLELMLHGTSVSARARW